MAGQLSATGIVFSDEFTGNGPIDSGKWNYHEVKDWNNNTGYYGRTQQRQELPHMQDGALRLRLDSYIPNSVENASFYGSEAITYQKFDLSNGPIAFEAKFKFAQAQPGIIGGFFTYALPVETHDEIDFEALSNVQSKIQTNIYANEGLGEGSPISYDLSNTLLDYHVYRIEWLPNAIRWLVDGEVVRVETNKLPQKAMELHLNIWAPPANWATGDSSLVPAQSEAANQTFYFDVDYVKVETVSQVLAGAANEPVLGTAASEYLAGTHADDRFVGHGGDDFIDGGDGVDTAVYEAASQAFSVSVAAGSEIAQVRDRSGAAGKDTLLGIETVAFEDHELDLAALVRAGELDAADFVPLVDLYVAYLDRAPDSAGLAYWAGRLADGASVASIAREFFHSGESREVHGETVSAAALVDAAYAEILGREPDEAGRQYWIGSLESGDLGYENFALAFVLAARGAAGGSDAEAIAAKARVGAYYALENGFNGGELARSAIDAATEQEAREAIDSHAAALESGAETGLVTRLAGVGFDAHANAASYGVSVWA